MTVLSTDASFIARAILGAVLASYGLANNRFILVLDVIDLLLRPISIAIIIEWA